MKSKKPIRKYGTALLQILDDGRLTDGQGRVVDFRNTVLIMTSNLGTEYVQRSGSLGFLHGGESDEEREAHDKVEKALKSTFRPEFINRIDEDHHVLAVVGGADGCRLLTFK